MSKDGGWLELESDPGVFTLLAKALGIKGVQVEEIYDLHKELTDRVYGYIFLFCWSDDRRSRRRQNAITEDMQIRDEERLRRMFFAKQIITNSCATHALLSVVLNNPSLALGDTLANFKEATREMDAESKGMAIGNVPEFADAHNRHSRPEPISINRSENNGAILSRSVEAYHYVSFVPVDGHLVELDGLKAHPIDHGPVPEGSDWTDKFREVMQERLGSCFGEANQDIRYNLLAVVDDRIETYQKRLCALEQKRDYLLTLVEKTFCSMVVSPVTSPVGADHGPVQAQSLSDALRAATRPALSPPVLVSPPAFPVTPATHGLASEPLASLSESHAQPVAGSEGGLAFQACPTTSIMSTAEAGSSTPSVTQAAASLQAFARGSLLNQEPGHRSIVAASGTEPLAKRSLFPEHREVEPLAGGGGALHNPVLSKLASATPLSGPLSDSSAAVVAGSDASAANYSALRTGSINAVAQPPNLTAAVPENTPALQILAYLAPSPVPGSPVRGFTSPTRRPGEPMPELFDQHQQQQLHQLAPNTSSDEVVTSYGRASSMTPRVNVTRSLSQEWSEAGTAENGAEDQVQEGNVRKAFKQKCDVLNSSLLTKLSADTATTSSAQAQVGMVTPGNAPATGGGGLPTSDQSHEVTHAAHVLFDALRTRLNKTTVTEEINETTEMLHDAVEPLGRDDPESHRRVKDIFRDINIIKKEENAVQSLLADEVSKRQRYKMDHSRRTHNYGPFISTFLVILAKEQLLQQAIEAEHPNRYQARQRTNSVSTPAASSSVQAPAAKGKAGGKKKATAPKSETKVSKASKSAAATKPPAKRGRPGRPPGSKSKKKLAALAAQNEALAQQCMDMSS